MDDKLAGKRADRIVIDDPHSIVGALRCDIIGFDLGDHDRFGMEYVVAHGSPLVLLTQSGGQIIDALSPRVSEKVGEIEVSGQITVHFVNEPLLRSYRVGAAENRNRVLRMIRPRMGRRAFHRLRGRAKAVWRSQR